MLSLSGDYLVYTVSSKDKELRVAEKAVSSPWSVVTSLIADSQLFVYKPHQELIQLKNNLFFFPQEITQISFFMSFFSWQHEQFCQHSGMAEWGWE